MKKKVFAATAVAAVFAIALPAAALAAPWDAGSAEGEGFAFAGRGVQAGTQAICRALGDQSAGLTTAASLEAQGVAGAVEDVLADTVVAEGPVVNAEGSGDFGPNYIDENGDGTCDNYGTGAGAGQGVGFVDADGDGVCDNDGVGGGRGAGLGAGGNFADADGDGVCDNYGAGTGCGRGNGAGYVDADGDGACDNYGAGAGRGAGYRGGWR